MCMAYLFIHNVKIQNNKESHLRNSNPSSSKTLCPSSVGGKGDPSLNHCTEGFGRPSTTHLNVAGSLRPETVFEGCSLIRGARFCAGIKMLFLLWFFYLF